MLLSGQKIYNEHFFAIGAKIYCENNILQSDSITPEIFNQYVSTLKTEIDSVNDNFKIILPESFIPLIEKADDSEKNNFYVIIDNPNKLNDQIIASAKENHFRLAIYFDKLTERSAVPESVDFVFVNERAIHRMGKIPQYLDTSRVVVENVLNYHMLEKLKRADIHLFMGTFLEKPTKYSKDEVSPNKTSIISLLTQLNDPDVELSSISKIVTSDTILSYKLLQMINSPLYRGVEGINSVQDALVRFGYNNLKKWVLMLSLCDLTDKPVALIQTALQRAIMCQMIAEEQGYYEPEVFYTAALLSTLDAFLDHPLPDLLEDAALTEEVKKAILFFEGDVGEVLKMVIDFQRGKVSDSDTSMTQYYIESSKETTQTLQTIGVATAHS